MRVDAKAMLMALAEVNMTSRIIIFLICVVVVPAFAAKIENIDFPDTMSVGAKSLVLNGTGLRIKRKLGIGFRVYVAGLYAPAKSNDAEKLIEPGDRILDMVFLRSLDKETMQEALGESLTKNCIADCATIAEQVKKLKELIVAVKENSRMRLKFAADGVDIEAHGKEEKSGRIEGAAFARNLMSAFLGKEPPTPELKKGLLGL